jgi:hypothetical protein
VTDGEFDERLREWAGLRLAILFAVLFAGSAAAVIALGFRWSVLLDRLRGVRHRPPKA